MLEKLLRRRRLVLLVLLFLLVVNYLIITGYLPSISRAINDDKVIKSDDIGIKTPSGDDPVRSKLPSKHSPQDKSISSPLSNLEGGRRSHASLSSSPTTSITTIPLRSSSPTTAVTTAVVQSRHRPDPNAVVQGLPLCNACYDYNPKLVTVYFDQFTRMNNYFGTFGRDEDEVPKNCKLPDGAKCVPQHTDKKADVIFKSVQAYASPLRYCYPQIVAILNSEAVVSSRMKQADIRIDHHLTSRAVYNEACGIPVELLATRTPPDPKTRKGTGLFLSNCGVAWRSNFIKKLMDHMYVYSYGHCFHNQKEPSDRNRYLGTYAKHARLHRTVVTFENTLQPDYISEKIMLVYESGAIPVYWGPPEIYLWVPGNHSLIDASKFAGPKELADYLKRVDEDDDLFRYHTTNLDIEKARKMKEMYCERYVCSTCKIAYEMKKKRYENGC